MAKPKQKSWTRQQITRRVRFFRALMRVTVPDAVKPKQVSGTEVFYETKAGRVRCLTYNFGQQEVLPLIINIHGSGFTMGKAEMDDAFLTEFVKKIRVKVISIDYSLAPEAMFPTALEECYAVVEYAKEHAGELGVDPARVVLMGHSAGGNFCAGICLLEKDRKRLGLRGIVLDYPPMDVDTDPYDKPQPKGCLPPGLCRIFDAAYRKPEDSRNPLVSPAFAAAEDVKDFPPTLVITAGNDSLADEAQRFRDTLAAAGVDVTSRRFPGVPHGFTTLTPDKGARMPEVYRSALEAQQMIVDFLGKTGLTENGEGAR